MVAFGFGQLAYLLHELQRFSKVAKLKRVLYPPRMIDEVPLWHLCLKVLGFFF